MKKLLAMLLPVPVLQAKKERKHPYTVGLINSKPDMTTTAKRLHVIPGNVPNLNDRPSGCPFHPRCAHCMEPCKKEKPILQEDAEGHLVACHLYQDKEKNK